MNDGKPTGLLRALAALGTAVLASSCCLGPVLLAALGATGAGFAAALAPYRPYFLGLTFVMLSGAFYATYRKRPTEGCCAEEAACALRSQRRNKRFLWSVTLFALAAMAYPQLAALHTRATAGTKAATAAVAEVGGKRLSFKVEGMTCESCATHVQKELAQVPGVVRAAVSFSAKQALVEWNEEKPDEQALRAAVEKAGYKPLLPWEASTIKE